MTLQNELYRVVHKTVRAQQVVEQLEMQKNMFFSNHVFYAKKKSVFFIKNSFLLFFFLFFSITGRFLINYSAIRVYL